MSPVSAVIDDMAFYARVFVRELFLTAAVLLAGVVGAAAIAVVAAAGPATTLVGPATTPPAPSSKHPAPVLPTDGVSYMNTAEGEPFTVDCERPVVIRYDASGAPYDADGVINIASEMYSASIGRPITLEHGYVDVNSPSTGDDFTIGIGWTGSLHPDDEHTEVLGQGGPVTRRTTVVGGHVVLAADSAWPAAGASPGSEVGVVLHELGHVAGLGHSSGGQMEAQADNTRPPGFSSAEQAALRWIFTTTCTNPNET